MASNVLASSSAGLTAAVRVIGLSGAHGEFVVQVRCVSGNGWLWSLVGDEVLVLDASGARIHRLTGPCAEVARIAMDAAEVTMAHLPERLHPAVLMLVDLGILCRTGDGDRCGDVAPIAGAAASRSHDAAGPVGDIGRDDGGVSRRRMLAMGAAATALGAATLGLPTAAAAASGSEPPDAVTQLTVVFVDLTTVRASWTAPSGATGYSVRHRKSEDLLFGDAVVVTDPTVDITGLLPETTYDVQVVAISVGGSSDPVVASGATAPIASGGTAARTVVDGADYIVRTFASTDTLVLAVDWSIEYLVVAGGGGGGGDNGGGGGAGGVRSNLTNPISAAASSYPVTVGAGGAGGAVNVAGTNGGASAVFGVDAAGGGGGGGGQPGAQAGKPGGSGGGGAGEVVSTGGAGNTPAVLPAQGTNGGATLTTFWSGAGGGGASAAGADGTAGAGGDGGAGAISVITGTSASFGGGGGGGANQTGSGAAGVGGVGGGGAGGAGISAGVAATANTGGGGGGGGQVAAGGEGGSGVVIVRYPVIREPLTVSATAGDRQVTVTWAWVGALPVDSYLVEQSADNGDSWTVIAAATNDTSVVVTGLTNGSTYLFRVTPTVAGTPGKTVQTTEVVLPPTATGGTVSTTVVDSTTYQVHTFTASDTFVLNYARDVEYLIVGGGGGGPARDASGGGGAGGLRTNVDGDVLARAAASYPVVVGAGGLGAAGAEAIEIGQSGSSGAASSVFGLSAAGGGGGGGYPSAGGSGGSGGGSGRASTTQSAGNTPATVPSQGNNGGGGSYNNVTNTGAGGGGGGAGGAGASAASPLSAGNGGVGREINITGTPTYFAGGGGGTRHRNVPSTTGGAAFGTGGLGGGGDGAPGGAGADQTGRDGVANTGGGGGAPRGADATGTGGNGGSGIVIIRYPI